MTRQHHLARAILAAIAVAAIGLVIPASASASGGWQVLSISNTAVAPGQELTYDFEVVNRSEGASAGPLTLTITLPSGLTGASFMDLNGGGFECGNVTGLTSIQCTTPNQFGTRARDKARMLLTVAVAPGASGVRLTSVEASGGGLTADTTVDPVTVTPTDSPFGIDAFDVGLGDGAGAAFSQAAAHPESISTFLDFNRHTDSAPAPFPPPFDTIGFNEPVEPVRNIAVDLPPGLLGSTPSLAQCTNEELGNTDVIFPQPLCPPASQVGTVQPLFNGLGFGDVLGPYPVFNMVPPPGVPARFGFSVFGVPVTLDASIRTDSDYGLTLTSRNTSAGIPIIGAHVDFWGAPATASHDAQHACPGEEPPSEGGPSCPPGLEPTAFLRTPTSCSAPGEGLPFSARVSSWFGSTDSRSIIMHEGPGYPYPEREGPAGELHRVWGPDVGIDGCDKVPFGPSLAVAPTTAAADSPSGLEVDIRLPQGCLAPIGSPAYEAEPICQSDLRKAVLSLPAGMSVNPATANGQQACSSAQIGLLGTSFPEPNPIHFDASPPSCPDAAKIGTVSIETPDLDHPLPGSVYLAAQGDNPFGSLLAMYLAVDDPASGIVIKLPGRIDTDPRTGQLTTTFEDSPQLPFSHLHVALFGGPRAALRTPAACGTYAAQGTFTPWSGNAPVSDQSSFQVTQGCGGGFDPKLDAGTENPLAGHTSPFNLRVSRGDGSQELAGLRALLPPGLSGYLAGIPYCPDATLAAISDAPGTGAAQEASPSCPAASRLGTVTVGAGAGPNPFYTSSGRAYLAGPYKGAPLSLAVVAPAVAGPFDLGSVVVRNAIYVDQATAQLTVQSDPLPTILHGIPLDLRDVRVQVDRPNFTLNPTNCEPMQVGSTITSSRGATANPSVHFQVSGCDRLGFKPSLSLALKGRVRRTANPSLVATYRARPGDANLARAQVKLPAAAFLDQSHIRTVCTRVQFAAHGCPAGSVYGHAEAVSPILGYKLSGAVYLRSSSHKLPDLVADLRGPDNQPVEIALAGKTDSVKAALRNTFEVVPDAPVTLFRLRLFGGKRGLIVMSDGFCAHPRASASLLAQNNRVRYYRPKVRAKCGKPKHRKHRR